MYKAGLVLEGGGMRGVFTAGVLDLFLEKGVDFECCLGVSAGACHACSFLSKQYGRAYAVCVNYLGDKRYCSIYSLVKTGDLFGAEMLYDIIPNELNHYDYHTFNARETKFYAVVTNCNTGRAEYLPVEDMKRDIIAVRASSSLPLLARMVEIGGEKYLDGGISDPIPVKQSMKMGNRKNVVVLTRPEGYRKKPSHNLPVLRAKYWDYPRLVSRMGVRDLQYNETLDLIKEQEEAGNLFVIRPQTSLHIGRVEKDRKKLEAAYQSGYEEAKRRYEEMRTFLTSQH